MFNKGDIVVWNRKDIPDHKLSDAEVLVTNPINPAAADPDRYFRGKIINDASIGWYVKGYEGSFTNHFWKLKTTSKKLEEYM